MRGVLTLQTVSRCCASGCGFLDAIDKLVALGADLNARDITSCTPLQNAAHGTYSALAAMPPAQGAAGGGGSGGGATRQIAGSGSGAANGHHSSSSSGYANGPAGGGAAGGQQLTASQQAAQAAMTNTAARADGLVPVRTGLAWAALGEAASSQGVSGAAQHDWVSSFVSASRVVEQPHVHGALGGSGMNMAMLTALVSCTPAAGQNDMLANLCGLTAANAPEGTPPHATQADWRGLGLMQLLKRASKQRRSGAAPPTSTTLDVAANAPLASALSVGELVASPECRVSQVLRLSNLC